MLVCYVNMSLMGCFCLVLFIIYCGINQLLYIKDNVMRTYGDCMVIILVILYVVESHVSWCTVFDPILVFSGLMVWIPERVVGSKWESMKRY